MSRITFAQALQAFMGDKDAATAIVGDAIRAAVTLYCAHGNDGHIVEALRFVASLKGASVKVRALQAGVQASGLSLKGPEGKQRAVYAHCAAAKGGEQSEAFGERAEADFSLAVGEVFTTPTKPAKADPAKVAARAMEALEGLTDKQLMAALSTHAGADMLARIARLQSVAAAEAAKAADRSGKVAAATIERAKAAAAAAEQPAAEQPAEA